MAQFSRPFGHIEPCCYVTFRLAPAASVKKVRNRIGGGSRQISPSCWSCYQISALTPSRASNKKDRAVTEQQFWLPCLRGSDSVIRRCRLQCPILPEADTTGRNL